MKPLVVFLNELSCKFETVQQKDIPVHIVCSVNALKLASSTRSDLILGSSIPLPVLVFGDDRHALAAIMSAHRLELRYLMLLARANPWPAAIANGTPGLTGEVRFNDEVGAGLTWAEKEETLSLSFGYAPSWANEQIIAEKYSIDDRGNETIESVSIPNLSSTEHVERWRDLLKDYGFEESVSSIIYRDEGFVICMFLNDHEPPHIHVQPPGGMRTLGKLRIDTLEMLDRELPADIKKQVLAWATLNKDALLQSWARCRAGNLPYAFKSQ